MRSVGDYFAIGFGLSLLLGALYLLVFVLMGGLRKGKKLGPIYAYLPPDDARARILQWAKQNRYEVAEDQAGKIVLNCSGMNQVGYVVIGLVLLVTFLIAGVLWFVLARRIVTVTYREANNGTELTGEALGANTRRVVRRLFTELRPVPTEGQMP